MNLNPTCSFIFFTIIHYYKDYNKTNERKKQKKTGNNIDLMEKIRKLLKIETGNTVDACTTHGTWILTGWRVLLTYLL